MQREFNYLGKDAEIRLPALSPCSTERAVFREFSECPIEAAAVKTQQTATLASLCEPILGVAGAGRVCYRT
jgi:hypothetical protein